MNGFDTAVAETAEDDTAVGDSAPDVMESGAPSPLAATGAGTGGTVEGQGTVAPPRPPRAPGEIAPAGPAGPGGPGEAVPPGRPGLLRRVLAITGTRAQDGEAGGPASGEGGGAGGRRRPQRPGDGGTGRIDLRNTWQVLVGSLLVPLGVVLVLIAWYGSAHTPYVQQQIPYLVSGSFIGLGCMILGGLLYWAHWLYRVYDQADLHHEEQLEALRAVVAVLAGANGPAVAGDAAGADAVASGFVATATGTVFHLPDCPVVAHHPEGVRTLGAGELAGMAPCRLCSPGGPAPAGT